MKSGKRKISVGDWCLTPSGDVLKIGFVATSYTYVSGEFGEQFEPHELRVLPASPADLAKSHALLMRWYNDAGFAPLSVHRHVAKFAAKQSRRGGKGRRHGTV